MGADGCPPTRAPALPRTSSLRESLYQLLSQTSPENMHRNVAQYGLDPATRYPTLNLRAVTPNQVRPPGTHQTPPWQAPTHGLRGVVSLSGDLKGAALGTRPV